MKYLLLLSILLSTTHINGATIVKRDELPHALIEKIEFDGHTYIHYKSTLHSAGDDFMHDPTCKCKEINEQNKEKNDR